MDAIGHTLITTDVTDSPIAIVTSAINLRYDSEGLKQLSSVLPQQYMPFALGVESHLAANRYVHTHPIFEEMQIQARSILTRNGVRDLFSHVSVEASIDVLLMKEQGVSELVRKTWGAFDWEAAQHYLPPFSRNPERAMRAIMYVQQRTSYGVSDAAQWLWYLVKRNKGRYATPEQFLNVVDELTEALKASGHYQKLIKDAQQEMRQKLI